MLLGHGCHVLGKDITVIRVPDFILSFSVLVINNSLCFLVTGIGHSTAKKLRTINILSVTDLLTCSQQVLEKEFGISLAVQMIRLCHGVDDSQVVPSGEFKSISDEDSFKECSTIDDARRRLKSLIDGLLPRVSYDTGIPQTVRVTVRKRDDKVYKRESRQCQIPNTVSFNDRDKTRDMLLTICLSLFNKAIDVKKPFHLTLIGVSLTNFHKSCVAQSKKISNFFPSHSQPTWSTSFATCSSLLLKDDQNDCKALNGPNDGTTKKQELQQSLVLTTQATLIEKSTNSLNMRKVAPSNICPSNIDPTVFRELPSEIQKELQASWQQQGKGDKVAKKVKKCSGIQKYFASQSTSKSGN